MQLARIGNKYLADAEPWKLIKTDPERVKTIMHTALQLAAGLSVLSEPFLPFTTRKLNVMLNIEEGTISWEDLSQKKELISAGHSLEKAQLLFQKIEDAQMEQQREKLNKSLETNRAKNQKILPLKNQTSFEKFDALKLQVGEILEARKVKKTKKLMELKVQIGEELRTIVSGIALDFDADALIGKKVTVLTNLAPRTLKGIESDGMILLGENEQGNFVFVGPDDQNISTGSVIN
jgi:methionyl-tRNA synthetase